MRGTYSNPTGLAMLDLQSGGKANTTQMGTTTACTYKVDGKTITVTCNANTEGLPTE